jgi:hypothetical protein
MQPVEVVSSTLQHSIGRKLQRSRKPLARRRRQVPATAPSFDTPHLRLTQRGQHIAARAGASGLPWPCVGGFRAAPRRAPGRAPALAWQRVTRVLAPLSPALAPRPQGEGREGRREGGPQGPGRRADPGDGGRQARPREAGRPHRRGGGDQGAPGRGRPSPSSPSRWAWFGRDGAPVLRACAEWAVFRGAGWGSPSRGAEGPRFDGLRANGGTRVQGCRRGPARPSFPALPGKQTQPPPAPPQTTPQ